MAVTVIVTVVDDDIDEAETVIRVRNRLTVTSNDPVYHSLACKLDRLISIVVRDDDERKASRSPSQSLLALLSTRRAQPIRHLYSCAHLPANAHRHNYARHRSKYGRDVLTGIP